MAKRPMPVIFSRVITDACLGAKGGATAGVGAPAAPPRLGLGSERGISPRPMVGDATSTLGMGDEESGVAVQGAMGASPATLAAAERDVRQTMSPRRPYRRNHRRPLTWVERAPVRFPLRSRGGGGDCATGETTTQYRANSLQRQSSAALAAICC